MKWISPSLILVSASNRCLVFKTYMTAPLSTQSVLVAALEEESYTLYCVLVQVAYLRRSQGTNPSFCLKLLSVSVRLAFLERND